MDKPKIIETFNDLIETIRKIFESDEVDVELVKDILASYNSKPSEWKQYAFWDPHRYTRNLVDTGNGKYNMMLVCWSQGQGSSIHDHANAHCFMKMLSGTLNEVRFEWPENKEVSIENADSMKIKGVEQISTDDVNYINGHSIEVKSIFHSEYGKRTPYKITHGKNKKGKEVLTYC